MRPCPICKSTKTLKISHQFYGYTLHCFECIGASFPIGWGQTKEAAIKDWDLTSEAWEIQHAN